MKNKIVPANTENKANQASHENLPHKFKRVAGKRSSKIKDKAKNLKPLFFKAMLSLSLLFSSNVSFAATADRYQFTGALMNIMLELQGAPIMIIVAMGIITGGFFFVFKGHDIGMKQVVSALIGGGLVLAAPSLLSMIPGMSGAVV